MTARMTKRTDGRYQTTARIEGRRVVAYGKTQGEARAKLKALLAKAEAGAPVRDSSRKLADWLSEWRETFLASSDRAAATKDLYRILTVKHVEPCIGHVRLDQLRASDIVRLMAAMEAAGLSASTRRNTYAALRGCLEDAVGNRLLTENPCSKVKRPRADRSEARSLDRAEVGALLAGAEGLRYGNVLRFIVGTGLRRGEALGMRWADVDLDRAEACIREGKTARSRRTVALSAPVVALLRAQRAAQAQERLAAGEWTETGYVFTTAEGQPVDGRNLLRTVKIAAAKAGLGPEIGVHSLRHSAATAALLAGVPLHVVSRSLGHSTISITADVYGHVSDDASQDAAARVAKALAL